MTNHPNRSRHNRTVAFKVAEGGRLVRVSDASTSDLVIRVTGVPASVQDHAVALKLSQICWRPMRGPWRVAWERVADAPKGAMLSDVIDANPMN